MCLSIARLVAFLIRFLKSPVSCIILTSSINAASRTPTDSTLRTTMSFWRTFGFHTVSAIDTILDKDEFTLEELLDEEEILQEVKSQNKRLLELYVRLL